MALFGSIGNGKVAHELVKPNEALALDGKKVTKFLEDISGYKKCTQCALISDNLSVEKIDLTQGNDSATLAGASSGTEKGSEMAEATAKKTTAAPKGATTKLREEITAATERVKTLALEGNADGVKELADEVEGMIGKLPTGDRTTFRTILGSAKTATAPAPAAEVAVPAPYDEVMAKLVSRGIEKLKEGAASARETNSKAEDLAQISLAMRVHGRNKAGLPDLMSTSKPVRDGLSNMYTGVLEGMDPNDEDGAESIYTLQRSVGNAMNGVLSDFVWKLNESEENHELFAEGFEKAADVEFPEDMTPAERVFKLYEHHGVKLPRISNAEKRRLERALKSAKQANKELEPAIKELAAKAGEDMGEGDGEGEGAPEQTAEAKALAAIMAEIEKANELIERLQKDAKKITGDDDKAKVKSTLRGPGDKLQALILGL